MIIECIKDAFDIQDGIAGTLSGGIEAPRILKSIEEVNGCYIVKWQNSETCGLSDCRYHNIDISVHTDVFELCDNQIIMNGSLNVFEYDEWVKDLISGFYQRWNLKEPARSS